MLLLQRLRIPIDENQTAMFGPTSDDVSLQSSLYHPLLAAETRLWTHPSIPDLCSFDLQAPSCATMHRIPYAWSPP